MDGTSVSVALRFGPQDGMHKTNAWEKYHIVIQSGFSTATLQNGNWPRQPAANLRATLSF